MYMNKLVDLSFNNTLADFIPYSDHEKLSEEKKPDYYCPDMFPFLCKKDTKANGLCRRTIYECNFKEIASVPNKLPIKYKKLN